MEGLLKDKNIVIIGGTNGIGLSAGKAFVSQGAKVLALGLPGDTLPTAHWTPYTADATIEGAAETAIQRCAELYGGFDALFHVVGGSGRKWGDGPLHEMSLEGWEKTLDLNLTSVMLSNRAAIRYFLAHQQKGSILNVSSVLAFSPSPKHFSTHAYATAKAAIIGFSKSIAAYYALQNIRVNILAPGLTNTPMAKRAAENESIQHFIKTKQPLDGGRMAETTDMDAAAVYFLSDHSAFTTGQVLAVDGGWSVSEGQYGG